MQYWVKIFGLATILVLTAKLSRAQTHIMTINNQELPTIIFGDYCVDDGLKFENTVVFGEQQNACAKKIEYKIDSTSLQSPKYSQRLQYGWPYDKVRFAAERMTSIEYTKMISIIADALNEIDELNKKFKPIWDKRSKVKSEIELANSLNKQLRQKSFWLQTFIDMCCVHADITKGQDAQLSDFNEERLLKIYEGQLIEFAWLYKRFAPDLVLQY
ncbi:MAG: hypothetical protein LBK26_01750 [Rickettsiales bacterium]|jgi:hypothetical protein|nr:hypothetical protein [Rickettsiales bacterium]